MNENDLILLPKIQIDEEAQQKLREAWIQCNEGFINAAQLKILVENTIDLLESMPSLSLLARQIAQASEEVD